MTYQYALKQLARNIAMKLTVEDIMLLMYIVEAWVDIQEETRRIAEKWNRLLSRGVTFRSPQGVLACEGQSKAMGGAKEGEEEVAPEVGEKFMVKMEEILSKIRRMREEAEVVKAKEALRRAKAFGLITQEEEQEIMKVMQQKQQKLAENREGK